MGASSIPPNLMPEIPPGSFPPVITSLPLEGRSFALTGPATSLQLPGWQEPSQRASPERGGPGGWGAGSREDTSPPHPRTRRKHPLCSGDVLALQRGWTKNHNGAGTNVLGKHTDGSGSKSLLVIKPQFPCLKSREDASTHPGGLL